MTKTISEDVLARLSEFVGSQMGLHYPKERWHDLLKGIRSASREFGFHSVDECIHWLLSSPVGKNQIEILACHLTVGETYFFRETKSFEALERFILPDLVRECRESNRRLRIWSAGCCTGEEPYSIAILLSKFIPDLKNWNVTILATDINPVFLQKAREGIYREWSFRGTPAWVKERYFTKTEEGFYAIFPTIKSMVKFSYLNLVEDVYPTLFNDTNAMNMIFCRNVMMYFTFDQLKKVVQRFHRTLLDEGWLIVGSSEMANAYFPQYATINFPGTILYRKTTNKTDSKWKDDKTFLIPEKMSAFIIEREKKIPSQSLSDFLMKSPLEKTSIKKSQKVILQEKDTSKDLKTEDDTYKEALTLYEAGYYEKAVDKMTGALDSYQNNAEAMALLAKAYANQGRLAEAMQWCKKAIAIDKLNPQYHHLRATIFEEQGHIEEAMKSLKRALYLNHNFVLAYFMLGNLTRQRGKLKESKKHFANALSILNECNQEDVLPESDGIVAGRLAEIIRLMNNEENLA